VILISVELPWVYRRTHPAKPKSMVQNRIGSAHESDREDHYFNMVPNATLGKAEDSFSYPKWQSLSQRCFS
ncbi:hypothetical protein L0152_26775, partial [bacterium]|nr:hypothetical protein [bacterium]